jgi:uncharacterized protein
MSGLSRSAAGIDLGLALGLTAGAGLVAALVAGLLLPVGGSVALGTVLVQGTLILLGVVWLDRRRGLRTARAPLRALRAGDAGLALVAFFSVLLVNAALMSLLSAWSPQVLDGHERALLDVAGWLIGGLSPWSLLAMMLFVGYYEEVLARGLILERCRVLFRARWPAVVVSSLLFGLGHAYQGWFGVLQTALIGMVFAALVLRWGRLWPVILAHGLLNFVALLAMRWLSVAG